MITLKALTTEDTSILYTLIDDSRAGLTNLVWSKDSTWESTKEFINYKNKSQDEIYGVLQDEVLVGVLELRMVNKMWELGYWLGTQYRGQGIMKVAVKMLIDNVVKTRSVTAHIRAGNQASYKTLIYAGLTDHHTEFWQGEEWLHLKRNIEI
jgi:RimJ/RimL family protein N-acetyltransferase